MIVKNYFPKSEEYHLKAQVLDSSRSITANISEGFGRFHHQENIQFLQKLKRLIKRDIGPYDNSL